MLLDRFWHVTLMMMPCFFLDVVFGDEIRRGGRGDVHLRLGVDVGAIPP